MRHSRRFHVLLALVVTALSLVGCVGKSCAGNPVMRTYLSPSATKMKPGATRTFTVQTSYSDDKGDHTNPAYGTWAFNASGPSSSEPANAGNGSCTWTAPSTPGLYTINAVGKVAANEGIRNLASHVTVSETSGTITEQMSERPPAAAPSAPVKVLDVGNPLGIRPGASAPSFTLKKPATIVTLQTYHYIEGGGPAPGTLGLRDAKGNTYGPWKARGVDGQGPTKNAFWLAEPKELLPAGTYTIVDSNPGTWSSNGAAKGVGFTTVQVTY